MVPSSAVRCILLFLGLVWKGTSDSYSCVCSYQENSEIFKKPDTSSSVDGYMKKSECKPLYNVTRLDKQFMAIQHEGKVGFVHTNPKIEVEACEGSIPPKDKITPTECPEHVRIRTDPQYLQQHGNKCYEFVPRNGTWLDAKHYCNQQKGHLLSVMDEEEQRFLQNHLIQSNFTNPLWLGLHDRVNEGHWEWENGAPVTYTNWMPGRYIDQYHDQEDCGLFVPFRKGEWDDVTCDGIIFGEYVAYNWMCQYDLDTTFSMETTTQEPHNSPSQSTHEPDSTHSSEVSLAQTEASSSLSSTLSSQITTPLSTNVTQKPTEPAARLCAVCSGPAFLCERLFESTECSEPNNYCINKITNNLDGSRMVKRYCGNFDTCHRDWFEGSSDMDKCRRFDEQSIVRLSFSCTFCCIQDNCNIPLRPEISTLYTEN